MVSPMVQINQRTMSPWARGVRSSIDNRISIICFTTNIFAKETALFVSLRYLGESQHAGFLWENKGTRYVASLYSRNSSESIYTQIAFIFDWVPPLIYNLNLLWCEQEFQMSGNLWTKFYVTRKSQVKIRALLKPIKML